MLTAGYIDNHVLHLKHQATAVFNNIITRHSLSDPSVLIKSVLWVLTSHFPGGMLIKVLQSAVHVHVHDLYSRDLMTHADCVHTHHKQEIRDFSLMLLKCIEFCHTYFHVEACSFKRVSVYVIVQGRRVLI